MASGVGNFLMKSVPPSRRQGALSPAAQLYRSIAKEVPRILTIYDIDMDYNEVNKHPKQDHEGHLMRNERIVVFGAFGVVNDCKCGSVIQIVCRFLVFTLLMYALRAKRKNPAVPVQASYVQWRNRHSNSSTALLSVCLSVVCSR